MVAVAAWDTIFHNPCYFHVHAHDLLFLEHPLGLGCHAVDAPVGEAVAVADGDGEAAVVGAHHLDHRVRRLARDLQRLPLAPVRRLVSRPVGVLACKVREERRDESFRV